MDTAEIVQNVVLFSRSPNDNELADEGTAEMGNPDDNQDHQVQMNYPAMIENAELSIHPNDKAIQAEDFTLLTQNEILQGHSSTTEHSNQELVIVNQEDENMLSTQIFVKPNRQIVPAEPKKMVRRNNQNILLNLIKPQSSKLPRPQMSQRTMMFNSTFNRNKKGQSRNGLRTQTGKVQKFTEKNKDGEEALDPNLMTYKSAAGRILKSYKS